MYMIPKHYTDKIVFMLLIQTLQRYNKPIKMHKAEPIKYF